MSIKVFNSALDIPRRVLAARADRWYWRTGWTCLVCHEVDNRRNQTSKLSCFLSVITSSVSKYCSQFPGLPALRTDNAWEFWITSYLRAKSVASIFFHLARRTMLVQYKSFINQLLSLFVTPFPDHLLHHQLECFGLLRSVRSLGLSRVLRILTNSWSILKWVFLKT